MRQEAHILIDVITQLANTPACITLYRLLQLSKATREALREGLVDSDFFLAQNVELSIDVDDSCPLCRQVMRQVPCVMFSPEDMQVKNIKYNIHCTTLDMLTPPG